MKSTMNIFLKILQACFKNNALFIQKTKLNIADSLAKDAAQKTLVRSLKGGQNINESMENAANSGAVVGEVLGSVEINKKEYLIFDTQTGSVIAVNNDNLQQQARTLTSTCPTLATLTGDKIEDFIQALNSSCK